MEQIAIHTKQIMNALGTAQNIASISHCLTRLRIVLHDETLVNQTVIQDLELVKGTQFQSGQFQIIIGPKVKDICPLIEAAIAANEQIDAPMKTKRWYQLIATTIAEILIPLIPMIIAGGLFLGVQNLIVDVPMSGQTLAQMWPILAELAQILEIITQAIFAWLPVFITWVSVKKFGGTPVLGLVLGICLVSPQLVPFGNEFSESWHFGVITIAKVSYLGQLLPAMLSGWLLATLEKTLTRFVPDVLKMIVVPFVSLLVVVTLSFALIAPVSGAIGMLIAQAFTAIFTGPWRIFTGLIFGAAYAPLTLTGLHHLFLFVDLQLIADGGTMIWPMIALSNIAQGSAALATYFLYRNNKKRQRAAIEGGQAAIMGVTEPAMFGVNLPLKYVFYAAMTGSALASGFALFANVQANAIGIGGLPAILSIRPAAWPAYMIAIVIAIIVPAGLTYIFGKKQKNAQ